MDRPTVALIITSYFAKSHADVVATRLIEGYPWQGRHIDSRVRVVSMYLEQFGDHPRAHDVLAGAAPTRPDIGVEISDRAGIPRYPTVAEAIGCGGGGVAVDGVVIIGEHGDYEVNEYGQKLYPRRRLFDAAVSTMISAGRFVPVFSDKHLAWSYVDAQAMYDTARRLHIPFLTGSTLPLAWRVPRGTRWPLDAPMSELVVIGHGPFEIYGFHNLEAGQAHAERRAGGETGVSWVRGMSGDAAARAMGDGTVDRDLFDRALGCFDLDAAAREHARTSPQDVFVVGYTDGLRAMIVNCQGALVGWSAAARGPHDDLACRMWLQGDPGQGHFIFLVRQLESLILTGVEPYPLERTLLTTGILDAAMHSRHDGGLPRRTPELDIAYRPVDDVPDTGVDLPLPVPEDAGPPHPLDDQGES